MTDVLDPEDQKLITLARSARARSSANEGAAVRDTDGRTYVATTVALPSLHLSALQLAVAMAVSSGALGLEAGSSWATPRPTMTPARTRCTSWPPRLRCCWPTRAAR